MSWSDRHALLGEEALQPNVPQSLGPFITHGLFTDVKISW